MHRLPGIELLQWLRICYSNIFALLLSHVDFVHHKNFCRSKSGNSGHYIELKALTLELKTPLPYNLKPLPCILDNL